MKVNSIIYVSSTKVDEEGQLIDAGVSGISGFVGFVGEQLFNKEFELKQKPLHQQIIDVKYWTYPTNGGHEKSDYQKIRTLKVAIVCDKYIDMDVPFFSVESINEAKKYRDEMNKEIEKNGAYAFFHMAGPIVKSSNDNSKFHFNDNEMILFTNLFMTVYNFEDSFKNINIISYKDFIKNNDEDSFEEPKEPPTIKQHCTGFNCICWKYGIKNFCAEPKYNMCLKCYNTDCIRSKKGHQEDCDQNK